MEQDKRSAVPKALTALAHLVGTEVKTRRLEIPEKFGMVYCAGFVFNKHIRLMILNYELRETLVIANPDVNTSERIILFKFQNVIPVPGTIATGKEIPSVLIVNSRVNPGLFIPIHKGDY